MTPSDTTTPGHSGPGSNDNEGELHILQSSRTGASLLNSSELHQGHTLGAGGSYPSAEREPVYSTVPAD